MEKSNKIIIIGGGYAGLRTVEYLAKNKQNQITLFDKNSYHYMQTEVYDLIANEEDFAQVALDLFTFCMGFENVVFCKQEVASVDFANKKVITQIQRYSYDYLVIAVGAKTKFVSNIEGLKEHSYGVKSLLHAMYFKQRFEMSLFTKVREGGTNAKPLNIIVAGGGLSGVEIVAQMASYSREFYNRNNFICRTLNIVLINSSKNILKGMDEKLVQKSKKRLKELGVIVKNEKRVVGLDGVSVKLSDGEILPKDFMIFAGGIEPNTLVSRLNLDKNERGYIETNEFLQVKKHSEVFAIGDCTTIYDANGKALAPTADIAEQMAEYCAKNIGNMISNTKPQAYKIRSRGMLIALGRNYAASKVFGLYFNGYIAYVVKKLVERVYAMRLSRVAKRGCGKIFES
ncbi:MAG: FAD-dependent oxidoreductase [Sulfurimonas sp.]|jgi:NADH dehydrogenase|nr:FAD-dependent oxidoreductase [Sulfurimonas sp.]